jgi:hypothetical protein
LPAGYKWRKYFKLLIMQINPIQEWQRLTEQYRQMSDDELRELAWDFPDLTETAQQALRSEMQSRGLGDPQAATAAPVVQPAAVWSSAALESPAQTPEFPPCDAESGNEPSGEIEYTWKTLLCECGSGEEAWQIYEALRRSGIESWIDGPRSRYAMTLENPRVMVAADQLDLARQVLALPIPPEIVEQSKAPVPEFVPPHCPWCGAEDPILEAVGEGNCWLCEACGAEWTDDLPALGESADGAAGR